MFPLPHLAKIFTYPLKISHESQVKSPCLREWLLPRMGNFYLILFSRHQSKRMEQSDLELVIYLIKARSYFRTTTLKYKQTVHCWFLFCYLLHFYDNLKSTALDIIGKVKHSLPPQYQQLISLKKWLFYLSVQLSQNIQNVIDLTCHWDPWDYWHCAGRFL